MKRSAILLVFCSLLIFGCNNNEPTTSKTELKTFDDSLSYALGMQLAEQTKRDSIKINIDMYTRGYMDASDTNKKRAISDSGIAIVYGKFQTIMQKKQAEQMAQYEAQQKAKAEELQKLTANFLSENRKKPGVKETKSGLQYEIIKQGTGRSIQPNDVIKMKYVAYFPTGEVFDSSYKNTPAQFPAQRVFPGWDEAASLMRIGGKYKFVFPPKLAFGEKGSGPIPPNAIIIFDVEVIDAQPIPQQMQQGIQVQPQRQK
ncbi:MAG TPA: FKBP-type peptidyl-prolyl cis-trans isomerase [Bacteroidota bacterium]|nr:FKBP-type peptidyl-prolyl cis-trans isomerase [Candidatus Kapabacteria bacterium]HRS01401.1 FKBP-type peptidyl-prolyl cis-trans isomerase [Bacteroidota bacterium]